MKGESSRGRSIPTWFLESLDASQQAEGTLRYVLLELRHLLESEDLESDLRGKLEGFQLALEEAAGRLTILQTGAREALDRFLAESEGSKLQRNNSIRK
jgi:hypothetical protein